MTGAHPVLPLGSARPDRPWTRTFRGSPESVGPARHFVSESLSGCPARETLVACVSEFAANAVVHTASGCGGVFIVEVTRPRDGVARVSVTDEGGASAPRAGSLTMMAEGGRGLALVAASTSRWGFAAAYPGRIVWAEASWPVGVPSPGQATRRPDRSRRLRPRLRLDRGYLPDDN